MYQPSPRRRADVTKSRKPRLSFVYLPLRRLIIGPELMMDFEGCSAEVLDGQLHVRRPCVNCTCYVDEGGRSMGGGGVPNGSGRRDAELCRKQGCHVENRTRKLGDARSFPAIDRGRVVVFVRECWFVTGSFDFFFWVRVCVYFFGYRM